MTAVAIFLLLAALVWCLVLIRHGDLLAGCLAVLLVGSCFGHSFLRLSVGPVPVTADRVVLALLAGLCLVYRWLGWTRRRPRGATELVLSGLVGMLVVSTLTHEWSFDQARPLMKLLLYVLMPGTLYWVARQMRLDERRLNWMFGLLAVFGGYLALTAVAEQQGLWWLVFPKYIVLGRDTEFLGRGRGPLLNPIGNGLFLTVGMFSALMLWPRAGWAGRVLVVLATVLHAAGLCATLTRSVWMGAGLALCAAAGLILPRRWSLGTLGAVTLVASLLLATQWNHLMAFKRDRNVSVHAMSQSAQLRPILAAVAWQMFQDQPLWGVGFGQYKNLDAEYINRRAVDLPLTRARAYEPHNVVLAFLAETGLAGTLLFVAVLALWGRDAWTLWRQPSLPLAARQQGLLFLCYLLAYVPNSMFHDVTIIPMAQMLMFFLAGVTRGLRQELVPEKPLPWRAVAAGSQRAPTIWPGDTSARPVTSQGGR